MSQELLRSLVWTDYRLAMLFAVLLPLILLIWSFVQRVESMQRLLTIYWRVSSLLMITVYLLIGNLPLSFFASLIARVLIPLSLWYWDDLNEEINDRPFDPLQLTFKSWRWAVTLYSGLGAIATLPFLPCALSRSQFATPFCQVWREPPLMYRDYFHAASNLGFLGFLGIVGLIIYLLYLAYFVFFRLAKQGRSAIQQ
ncbi:MAG: DUF3177 family protein [Leptolyngbyaceae cyanobacterium SL_7_1]|nr:DUF3177 family protein [Leptolyngbyaceae cyanobacterium SL_7_1]